MPAITGIQIINESVEAHGGMDFWNSLEALDAEISASGFLFTAKRRPLLRRVRMRAFTREPKFSFFDFPRPGLTSELVGTSKVRILDNSGTVIAVRENPRSAFRGIRHSFSWDDLDFIYFGGYATWNYLTAPFLLARPGFVLEAREPLTRDPQSLIRVEATFPDDIPTHSRRQIFYFDDQRLLRRLDYIAEVVGGWAHAAHFCEEYRTFDGLTVPTRRFVLPLFFGTKPLPGPRLVDLEVHSIKPVPASRNL